MITGDRVTLSGRAASVRPGPGRAKIGFISQTLGGHRYVIPSDALGLLRAGRLDKRLFDVTAIGPGDTLPLLVTYAKGAAAGTKAALAGNAAVTRDIPAVRTLASEPASTAAPRSGRR